MSNEKPVTISELQKILEDGNPRHIEILPDGSLMAHECVCNSCESLRTQLAEARKRVEELDAQLRQLQDAVVNPSQPPREI